MHKNENTQNLHSFFFLRVIPIKFETLKPPTTSTQGLSNNGHNKYVPVTR
jgi:hypothetical protein